MAEPSITFGEQDQWHYDRSTKTYDLTRGSPSPKSGSLKIKTTQGPGDTYVTISPALSALVVVDMQNFFLDPSCRAHPTGLAAVEPTLRAIKKCREAGISVVWLNWGLDDDDLAKMPPAVLRGFAQALTADNPPSAAGLGVDMGDGKGRTLVAGEWNSAIYWPLLAEAQAAGDSACSKNRMSGLWSASQPLWRHLEAASKKTLLFAGVNTDQCVLGTLADAYNAGWDCLLVDDCCATTTPGAREVCLYNISKSYGFVIDSETLTAAEAIKDD